MIKVLNLTLKRQFFNQIANGTKKIEYREVKKYWTTRIKNREYSEIYFRNGYNPRCPFMRIEYLGYSAIIKVYWRFLEKLKKDEILRKKIIEIMSYVKGWLQWITDLNELSFKKRRKKWKKILLFFVLWYYLYSL